MRAPEKKHANVFFFGGPLGAFFVEILGFPKNEGPNYELLNRGGVNFTSFFLIFALFAKTLFFQEKL